MSDSALDIELSEVSFAYQQQWVVEAVNLHIRSGEFIGLIGPNGGGKTTLIRLLLGLLSPQRGQVRILGTDPLLARRYIGYVPQAYTFTRNFPITVERVVMMGTRSAGFAAKERRKVVQEALHAVALWELRNAPLQVLSGGQLQRTLVARALACRPRILILDEPVTNVDTKTQQDLFTLFRDYEDTVTIILVSHDVGFIYSRVHHVACINKTLACHPVDELTPVTFQQLYGSPVKQIDHTAVQDYA